MRTPFSGGKKYLRRAEISIENSETRKRYDTCVKINKKNKKVESNLLYVNELNWKYLGEITHPNHSTQPSFPIRTSFCLIPIMKNFIIF